MFLNDVTFGPLEVRYQRVWARQLNIESDLESDGRQFPAKVVNDGGHLWILGYKTEDQGLLIQTVIRETPAASARDAMVVGRSDAIVPV